MKDSLSYVTQAIAVVVLAPGGDGDDVRRGAQGLPAGTWPGRAGRARHRGVQLVSAAPPPAGTTPTLQRPGPDRPVDHREHRCCGPRLRPPPTHGLLLQTENVGKIDFSDKLF